jgi:hypothetical protein
MHIIPFWAGVRTHLLFEQVACSQRLMGTGQSMSVEHVAPPVLLDDEEDEDVEDDVVEDDVVEDEDVEDDVVEDDVVEDDAAADEDVVVEEDEDEDAVEL